MLFSHSVGLGFTLSNLALKIVEGALKIAQTKWYGYLHKVLYFYRVRNSGTGSAGLNPQIILKAMVDVENMAFSESRGLLHMLLFVRVKSHVDLTFPKKIRLPWVILRKFIRLVHYLVIIGG